MKRILFLGVLFCSIVAFGQGTTQKEYNYASKGYADDLAMGKDVIAGYKVETDGKFAVTAFNELIGNVRKTVVRKSSVLKLVRVENNTVAALILVQNRKDTNTTTYFAIPNRYADETIWEQSRQLYINDFMQNSCKKSELPISYGFNVIQLLSSALSN